jgi:hypothetical protein
MPTLESNTTASLSVVSLEGNWNAAINAPRLELAASLFTRSNADFMIVSGTFEPGSMASSRGGVQKLGRRNTEALRIAHDIDPALIIPAHEFPFDFTYTTIEAFGNACVLGWLMSGFEKQSDPVRVDFAPISSGAHCQRVHALNLRACQALTQFNVETRVEQQQPLEPDEPEIVASELTKLTQAGAVISTGRWLHGAQEWSFDDPHLMRTTMEGLFIATIPGFAESQIRRIGAAATLAQRYGLMQMVCEISANAKLTSSALERIFARTSRRFGSEFDIASASQAAEYLARPIG